MRLLSFVFLAPLVGVAVAADIVVKPQEKPIDPANLDPSVKPWEDFYRYANGGWLDANPIPPEYSAWGAFHELHERNNAALRKELEAAAAKTDAKPGSPEQLVGDFYASGMDEAAIEKAGIEPLAEEFARIAAIDGPESLTRTIAHLTELGVDAGFWFGSGQDAKDSESVIAQLYQSGLGLPEREYYREKGEDAEKLREAYVAHVARTFELLGDSKADAEDAAKRVMAFETKLAEASMPNVELRDPDATYHKKTPAELRELMPNFAWDAWFDEIGIREPDAVNVGQPKFFQTFDALVKDAPLEDWRAYLRWHLASAASPYLGKNFVNEWFDFYGRTLNGSEELRPRWKRVMATIDDSVGEALGQLYVRDNFPPEAKEQALELVANLREALRDRIRELPWMTEKTKEAALRKLEAMRVKIGYPDVWRDYSGLEINRGPYVGNVFRANAFEFRRDLAKIGKPVDRNEWEMSPPTVNAYFHPAMNEIVFPAGILQPPFFDPNADDAVNYGGIGAVIGHELTHGFDDQGRKYDEKGNLANWWTAEDLKNFEARSQKIIEQFDGYEVLDGLKINGRLTTGENIADLGGAKIAFAALQKALARNPAPAEIDGFTPAQRFFLSYAQTWRTNERDESLRVQVKTDPHSPAEFRVNGPLSNLEEFVGAFECPPDSPMVRKDRVEIW